LEASQLKSDVELFALGIDTTIGERGINISGGQKARVSLARALYADADIYLMDDPLSAVDPNVAQLIFKDCI
jgi:ATP-binding cassette subfamily C (CFTR/MRP) protein 4